MYYLAFQDVSSPRFCHGHGGRPMAKSWTGHIKECQIVHILHPATHWLETCYLSCLVDACHLLAVPERGHLGEGAWRSVGEGLGGIWEARDGGMRWPAVGSAGQIVKI